jgi:hypothetical protein
MIQLQNRQASAQATKVEAMLKLEVVVGSEALAVDPEVGIVLTAKATRALMDMRPEQVLLPKPEQVAPEPETEQAMDLAMMPKLEVVLELGVKQTLWLNLVAKVEALVDLEVEVVVKATQVVQDQTQDQAYAT